MANLDKPLVSVVMINRNDSTWLPDAVDSVLSQKGISFELIIVDDASTDDSPTILADVAKKNPQIRPLFLQENVGISGARNRGIEIANGTFISLIDSDDRYLPDTLTRFHESFLNAKKLDSKTCFLMSDAWLINEKNQRFGRYITREYWGELNITSPPLWTLPSAWFFPKAVPVRFFEPYMVGEAPIFVNRMAEYGTVAFLGEPLIEYRMRAKSVSNVSGRRTLRSFNATAASTRLGRLELPLLPEEVPLPSWRQTATWTHGRNAKALAANNRWFSAGLEVALACIANPSRTFKRIWHWFG